MGRQINDTQPEENNGLEWPLTPSSTSGSRSMTHWRSRSRPRSSRVAAATRRRHDELRAAAFGHDAECVQSAMTCRSSSTPHPAASNALLTLTRVFDMPGVDTLQPYRTHLINSRFSAEPDYQKSEPVAWNRPEAAKESVAVNGCFGERFGSRTQTSAEFVC